MWIFAVISAYLLVILILVIKFDIDIRKIDDECISNLMAISFKNIDEHAEEMEKAMDLNDRIMALCNEINDDYKKVVAENVELKIKYGELK